MTAKCLRIWTWLHTWSSLVCTVFLLLACLTGLPLIFSQEIEHMQMADLLPPEPTIGAADASADRVLAAAQAQQPDWQPQFMGRDPDRPIWFVTLGPTAAERKKTRTWVVDARNAALLGAPQLDPGFMHWMERLHTDLFAGAPGMYLLGAMALVMLVSLVSGTVVYAPFMRRVPFGTVRSGRSRRLQWLDLHNLVGIVILTWVGVVALTGAINTLADPLVKEWRRTQLADMLAPYAGRAPLAQRGPLQTALQAAEFQEPNLRLNFVAFPGTRFASEHHYAIVMQGREPLSSRLLKPVLVDAATAQVSDSRSLPWYMQALLLSQPLHFGDYGGVPLKVAWALLTLATIVVLLTGLWLFAARRRSAVPVLRVRPGMTS
jgi:uncharacterized iron-regulated membrane protein